MKKTILLVISLFLALLLFSCQNQSDDNPETTGPETEKAPITETTAPETTEKTPPSTNNTSGSQETDKNTDTENKNETPPTQITTVPNGLRDIEEPFLSVFTNQQPIDFGNEFNRYISDLNNSFKISSYAIIDLNQDNQNEILLSDNGGIIHILRKNGDSVIGFSQRIQSMHTIFTDGTFLFHGNTYDEYGSIYEYGCAKFDFVDDNNVGKWIEIYSVEQKDKAGTLTYYVNGKSVTKEEYDEFESQTCKEKVIWHNWSDAE